MLTDEQIDKLIDEHWSEANYDVKLDDFARAIYKLGQQHRDDCNTCANRGLVYVFSQEMCCEHCINGHRYLKNMYEELKP